MKKIQVTLNEMEAKVYELCKLATKGSDDGCEFCFDEVAVPANKQYGLSQNEVKGYLSSLKKKDVLRKLSDSYYDFMVVELVEDDWCWCFLDELYQVEITVEGAEKPAPSTKKFKLYQLPVKNNAVFMDLEFVKENNIMPALSDYNKVWEGSVEDLEDMSDVTVLDHIYMKYQGTKPEGYTGRSLSTSDVVELDGKYYYCDSYGWELLDWSVPAETVKKYIVTADNVSYHSIYDTKAEADAKAEQLNDEYYQHKIWNVEEVEQTATPDAEERGGKLYDVYRNFEGISEHRFTGTHEQCKAWISQRGDTGRANYTIENPHTIAF